MTESVMVRFFRLTLLFWVFVLFFSCITPKLIVATRTGSLKEVNQLISKGADVNDTDKNDTTALMVASSNGFAEVVKTLIDKKADVNAFDENKRTALMFASIKGHMEVAKILIDKKARVNAFDKNKRTALMMAASRGYNEIVELLLEKGANVNAKDTNNYTASMYAWRNIRYGNKSLLNNPYIKIAKMLIGKGGGVNVRYKFYKSSDEVTTPLILASKYGYAGLVRLLLEKNADISLVDNYKKNAFMYAVINESEDILKIFLEKGLDPKYEQVLVPNGYEREYQCRIELEGCRPHIDMSGWSCQKEEEVCGYYTNYSKIAYKSISLYEYASEKVRKLFDKYIDSDSSNRLKLD